jgi:hypothetical protein
VEIDFPYEAPATFEDLETGDQIPVVPDTLSKEYRELMRQHVRALTTLCTESRIDYALFNTSVPLDHALFSFLSARERLSRVR